MKNISSLLKPALLLSLLLLASGSASAEIIYVVNSQSRTLSRIDTSTDTVNNSFALLGNVPNKIVVDNDYIWAVNSGDNAIQKIDRDSGNTLSNIFIGPGVNPWDAVLHEGMLYVSGLFTGKVYRVDLTSGSVTGSVSVGTAPEALLVMGNKLYVCNSGNYAQNYAGSSVSVIDLISFTKLRDIPVSPNPQYLALQDGALHVSCTGNWADIAGSICVIDSSSDSLIQTIPLGGTPGRIWIADSELALVADSNGINLFSYDPVNYSILHGISNPLPNGGSEVVGNSSLIAVLAPNWSANGTVKLLHPDLSFWKDYTVALMSTDLKLAPEPTSNQDPQLSLPVLQVYPNPLSGGSVLTFKADKQLKGELQIFNLRGQMVERYDIEGKDISLRNLKLGTGVYFYRLQVKPASAASYQGKFMVVN
ncbi:MAG TPA: T9SS type A sorting domain-containing protein [Candidatus Cloacimonadota bacterium]|nr:T9SS type A sorting domain-containing protein [Candidatus Cloacimonadota bacterium]